MAMTMKKPSPETTPTLADVQRAYDEATAERDRLSAIKHPNPNGYRPPVALAERWQAERDLPAAERRFLEAAVALEEAKAAENERKRQRHAELRAQFDAEVRREFAALKAETDAVAERWAAFATKNRERDNAVIHSTPAGEFRVPCYAVLAFPPLAGDLVLGNQWEQWRNLLARDWA